jgi:hypothetical protein
MVVWSNGGMANGGMVVWWNGAMVEWWNGEWRMANGESLGKTEHTLSRRPLRS